MTVDTRRVQGRRPLKFTSYDQLLAEAERLARGPTRPLGNWSVGQVLEHLARTMNMAIDGTPLRVPWLVRWAIRLFFRRRLLDGPMPAGFQLPSAAARELVPAPISADEGLAHLRAAVARLARQPHREPSPTLGPLTREEYDRLHFSHAALHMSFLLPE